MAKLTIQFDLSDEWNSFDKFYPDKDLRDRMLIEELLYHIKFEDDIYDVNREDSEVIPIKVLSYENN